MTSLISRQLLVGNPHRAHPRISPDGTQLIWLEPVDGVLNVWLAPIDDLDAAKPITHATHRGVQPGFWSWTGRQVLYVKDNDGDENWRLFGVDVETGKNRDYTPFEDVAVQFLESSHKHPNQLLIGLNNRDPRLHDVYRLDLDSGELELVAENPGVAGHVADSDLNVRLRLAQLPDGGMLVQQREGDEWTELFTIPHGDALTTSPAGFGDDGDTLYLIDSRDRDTAGLFQMSLSTGETTLLAEDPRADIAGVMMHPLTREVEAASFVWDRRRQLILDESVRADLEALAELGPEITVVDRTEDDRTWVVALHGDVHSTRYVLWDRDERTARDLFSARPELDEQPLVPMHPVVISARDGLDLVSYLSLPADTDPEDTGRPSEPVPMVLLVHGGPWARDTWGTHPEHQLLANRGYAVLSVNFRGSTGFGKSFLNAADREWAGTMHDDLIDAVEWAIEQGITQRDTVAIMGGSYGGYATLVGMAFTPEVFACGIDIVGPSNLETLISSIPPYWEPLVQIFHQRVGNPTTDEGRAFLASRSPLFKADQICRPLLIAQGANDPRVKQAEADQIVSAMKEHGIPGQYVLYPDEGHGFARQENRLSFYSVVEQFLAEHLGGRAEPIGDAFEGSSAERERW